MQFKKLALLFSVAKLYFTPAVLCRKSTYRQAFTVFENRCAFAGLFYFNAVLILNRPHSRLDIALYNDCFIRGQLKRRADEQSVIVRGDFFLHIFPAVVKHDSRAFNLVQQRCDAFAFIVFFARVLIKSRRHGIFICRKNERNC